MDWSDEERAALKQLYESGCSSWEILKVLKSRTPSGIRHKLRELFALGEIEERKNGGEIDYDLLADLMKVKKI